VRCLEVTHYLQFLGVATLLSIITVAKQLPSFSTHNFIVHTYRIIQSLSVYEVYNIQLFAFIHDDVVTLHYVFAYIISV